MKMFVILYRWLDRLLPPIGIGLALLFICLVTGWPGAAVGGIVGWLTAGWSGLVLGLVAGPFAWLVLLGTKYYIAARIRFQRRLRKVSSLPTEQLRRIATEPASPDLGIALMELDRRGIDARPSLGSLFVLLTAADSNRRGLGMSLLYGLYPSVAAKLPMGVSNMDPPDVWRERLAALGEEI